MCLPIAQVYLQFSNTPPLTHPPLDFPVKFISHKKHQDYSSLGPQIEFLQLMWSYPEQKKFEQSAVFSQAPDVLIFYHLKGISDVYTSLTERNGQIIF